ncbi:MAG TPA: helix-turn-helix domain-containing protein [Roseiarcus sp.]|nr:helix-turn-helix domain-containing protein [Roseiarcus sp.]
MRTDQEAHDATEASRQFQKMIDVNLRCDECHIRYGEKMKQARKHRHSERISSAAESLPLLKRLPARVRANLLKHAIEHRVAPGTVLFEQGDAPNFQHVIISGSAQLIGRSAGRREVLIEVVRAPELIIPAAVWMNSAYLVAARVPEPSRILLIHGDAFRSAVVRNATLAREVMSGLAEQFRRMVCQVKNLKLRSATERVGCYVLTLSRRQGTPDRAALPYEKNLIASELGLARESFSRALSALQKSGVVVRGETIVIRDPARFAAEFELDPLVDSLERGVSAGGAAGIEEHVTVPTASWSEKVPDHDSLGTGRPGTRAG